MCDSGRSVFNSSDSTHSSTALFRCSMTPWERLSTGVRASTRAASIRTARTESVSNGARTATLTRGSELDRASAAAYQTSAETW
jgi:hypothetical protein